MNTCKYYWLFFIVFISFNKTTAQVPGYLGKRFIVQYDASLYPRLSEGAYFKDPKNYPAGVGLNYRHNFCSEIVVSTSLSLGASFMKLRTSQYGVKLWNSENSYDYDYHITNLNTTVYSIYFKKFSANRKGSLAPLGTYNKVEMAWALTSGAIRETSPFSFKQLITYGISSAKTLVFIYSLGQQQIIINNFLLDYGLEFALIPQSIPVKINNAIDLEHRLTGNLIRDNQKLFNSEVNDRLFNHMVFNAHIGIGFLLF